jgi:alpha/beta superfamily hydrolase
VSAVPAVDANPAEEAWATAVLLHPHPDYGGNRFNIVIEALYRALPPAGVSALRFDFSSSDVAVAAGEVVEVVGVASGSGASGPVVLVGYSFGADVATTVADERVAGWFLIAPPLVDPGVVRVIAGDPRPKAIAVPEHDQFSPPGRTRHLTESWTKTTVTDVPGADHFLAGRTGLVADQVVSWLRATFSAEQT